MLAPAQILSIDGRAITPHLPPYIVAELSCNHNGSYGRMIDLIDAAQGAGADAVKLQAYTPEELSKPGTPLWDLYQKAQTPREWFPDLYEYCRKARITCFASAFSVEGVKFLETLDTPAHKIASPERRMMLILV
jgi:sialic acid synthase SpsE